jgi:hypothetical protein
LSCLNRALNFANLPIEHPNIIPSIQRSLAALSFVAGQGVVILLIDIGIPIHGLEVVPPGMVGRLAGIGDADPLANPPAAGSR